MKKNSIDLAPNAKWIHESSAEVKIIQINGHSDSVVNSQIIENDKKLFTISTDNTARIWEFPSGNLLKIYADLHDSLISRAKVSHDSTKFVSCSWDKTIKYWDIETGKILWGNEHEYMVQYCDISSDGRSALSVSDVDFLVKIWDARSGKLIRDINKLHSSTITTCQFLPKNDRIISTSMDKTCNIYDLVAKKTTISLNGHTGIVSNCAFTSDERIVATSSWDKTVLIWDIATGSYRKHGPTVLTKGHEGSVSCCAFSKDGQLCVSGGYDGRLVLWDMIGDNTPKLVLRGHPGWINDVSISADNRRIVTAGKDKEVRIWNIENSDNIKVVVERNKNIANKVIHCTMCLRAFAVSKIQRKDTRLFCVFCRLQEGNKRQSLIDSSDANLMSAFRNRKDSLINSLDSNLMNALHRNRKESLKDAIDQNTISVLRTRKDSLYDANNN